MRYTSGYFEIGKARIAEDPYAPVPPLILARSPDISVMVSALVQVRVEELAKIQDPAERESALDRLDLIAEHTFWANDVRFATNPDGSFGDSRVNWQALKEKERSNQGSPFWDEDTLRAVLAMNDPNRSPGDTAFLFIGLKRYDEALEVIDRGLLIDPDDLDLWHKKGVVLLALERFAETIAFCERMLRVEPDFFPLWRFKGMALSSLDRPMEALLAYEEAIHINPENKGAWQSKAIVLRKLNREAEARQAEAKAATLKGM